MIPQNRTTTDKAQIQRRATKAQHGLGLGSVCWRLAAPLLAVITGQRRRRPSRPSRAASSARPARRVAGARRPASCSAAVQHCRPRLQRARNRLPAAAHDPRPAAPGAQPQRVHAHPRAGSQQQPGRTCAALRCAGRAPLAGAALCARRVRRACSSVPGHAMPRTAEARRERLAWAAGGPTLHRRYDAQRSSTVAAPHARRCALGRGVAARACAC
jgi:hypothetical protein